MIGGIDRDNKTEELEECIEEKIKRIHIYYRYRKCNIHCQSKIRNWIWDWDNNKIRNWIWDWDNHYCFESSSSNGNDGMDGNYAVDGRKEKDDSDSFSSTGNSSRNSSTTSNSTTTTTSTSNANKLSSTTTTTTTTKTTTTTNTRNENIYGNKSLNFALIGHGVPFQLLQDHVDVAWEILNSSNNATHTHHTLSGGEGNIMNIVENKSEAVECTFHNGSGDLTMNW